MESELERAYIIKELGKELTEYWNLINNISEKNTSYPIQKGQPTASRIAYEILKSIRKKIDIKNIKLEKNKKNGNYEGVLEINEIDKININISFNKILGLKKNEFQIKEKR